MFEKLSFMKQYATYQAMNKKKIKSVSVLCQFMKKREILRRLNCLNSHKQLFTYIKYYKNYGCLIKGMTLNVVFVYQISMSILGLTESLKNFFHYFKCFMKYLDIF